MLGVTIPFIDILCLNGPETPFNACTCNIKQALRGLIHRCQQEVTSIYTSRVEACVISLEAEAWQVHQTPDLICFFFCFAIRGHRARIRRSSAGPNAAVEKGKQLLLCVRLGIEPGLRCGC